MPEKKETKKVNKSVNISFKITEEEKVELQAYCLENDITLSWLVRRAVKEYMQNHKND